MPSTETIATFKMGGKTYEIDHHGITFPDTQWGLFGVWTGGSEVAKFTTCDLLDHTELPDSEELIRLALQALGRRRGRGHRRRCVMSDTGFVPGYGLRVVQTRTALKKAVLDEISATLDMTSTLHSPDEAWDAITAVAKDMIAAQDEWAAYIERKRTQG